MELTRERIIKMLPLGKELKDKLLNQWESLDKDTQFTVERLLWDTYYAIYQLRLQENIRLQMLDADKQKIPLGANFHDQIEIQTEKELEAEGEIESTSSEIDLVRTKLQNLLGK